MVMIVCGCLESSDHLSEEEDSEGDQWPVTLPGSNVNHHDGPGLAGLSPPQECRLIVDTSVKLYVFLHVSLSQVGI